MENIKAKLVSYIENTRQVLSEVQIVAHGFMMVDEKKS